METKKLEAELREIYSMATAARDSAVEVMDKILALKQTIREEEIKELESRLAKKSLS